MADEAPKTGEGKKSKLKMIIIFAVVLFGEAGLIIGAMMMISKPADVGAAGTMPDIALSEDEKIVETQVLDAKLPNSRTGATYIYATEIYVQSKRRYEERIHSELEQFQNEIKAEITAIWRTSDPPPFPGTPTGNPDAQNLRPPQRSLRQ